MEIPVEEDKIIPPQNLEGKLAFIGKITKIVPADASGDPNYNLSTASHVDIQVLSRSCSGLGWQKYTQKEYHQLEDAYGVHNALRLVGRPVIAVYQQEEEGKLTGLIPLDLS